MQLRPTLLNLLFVAGLCSGAMAQSAPSANTLPAFPPAAHDSREQIPVVGRSGAIAGTVAYGDPTSYAKVAALLAPSKVCYAIRSYNFVADGDSQDATRLKDSTTCEPATKSRLKSAIGSGHR